GQTKRTVLIVELQITRIISGLGNTPGNAALSAVLNLAADDGAVRLVQQRPRVASHYQERHQVLEHRRSPGYERAAPVNLSERPAQVKPMLLRDVALRDGDEARDP